MKYLIVIKNNHGKIKKDLQILKKVLLKKHCKFDIITYDDVEEFYIGIHDKNVLKNTDYDVLISFGGDGTILKSARIARKLDIPILGINEGKLGFLNTLNGLEGIEKYIEKVNKKQYLYEKRSMINMEVIRDNRCVFNAYAVNESTIMTKDLGKIGKYEVYIEDLNNAFNEYRADGLIISNPTGSTGHSFSAGGPIVAPNVNCFIITAICPHAFNQRSIVVSSDEKIFVKIVCDNQVVDIDGRIKYNLDSGDFVKISKLKKQLNFITFEKNSFINSINNKIKNL